MSRPRPPSLDCIKDIKDRVELLQKIGIKKDVLVNTEEASAITGLSKETMRRYGTLGYISTVRYPNRNLYLLSELCEYVERHYHKATGITTSQMNNYRRRGRPCKKIN